MCLCAESNQTKPQSFVALCCTCLKYTYLLICGMFTSFLFLFHSVHSFDLTDEVASLLLLHICELNSIHSISWITSIMRMQFSSFFPLFFYNHIKQLLDILFCHWFSQGRHCFASNRQNRAKFSISLISFSYFPFVVIAKFTWCVIGIWMNIRPPNTPCSVKWADTIYVEAALKII